MPAVRNVVFDIGNVLIHWDPPRLYESIFGNRRDAERFLAEICTPEWNLEFDRGRPFAEGIDELVERHPDRADEIRAWDERWHDMVSGPIEGTVALLERLRAAGVPTFAITNFSREKFAEALVRFPFLTGFRDAVVSAHEGLVKPDPAIYRILLTRNALDPASCLFVDDVAVNVEAARAVGMRAVQFTTPEAFAEVLHDHALL